MAVAVAKLDMKFAIDNFGAIPEISTLVSSPTWSAEFSRVRV